MLTQTQQVWTLIFMIVVTAFVIGADIYFYAAHGRSTTISAVSRSIFDRYPVVAVLFLFWLGVLAGHLFPPR